MHRNRMATEPEYRLPQPPPPPVSPVGFVFCPLCGPQGLTPCQQWLYQEALAQAQAVARPSILERDLLGVWN